MASMTSPEQGAQQEWRSTFLCPPGGVRMGRSVMGFIYEWKPDPGSPIF
jgi:hypothetical protein